MRSGLCAVAVVAGLAIPAKAAPARWAVPDEPYRAVVKLTQAGNVPEAGVAITLPEFGWCTTKSPEVVLTDAQGVMLPVAVVWRGENQDVLLLAESLAQDQEYFVYFGGAFLSAGKTWSPKVSLLLETRRAPAGAQFNEWPQLEAAWRAATESDGAGWVDRIYHGANPFGDDHRFLSHYTGYLRTDPHKPLTLCTLSSDASFVLVDGQPALSWPGEHGPHATAKDVPTKTVTGTGGWMRIDYYHAKTGNAPPAMMLGWQLDKTYQPIPENQWAHPGRSQILRLESARGLPVPVPVLRVVSYIGYAGLWLYEVTASLLEPVPENWTVHWRFSDGTTRPQPQFTHVVVGNNSQSITVQCRHGADEVTARRRLQFVEGVPAASVQNGGDLQRYVAAITAENAAELPMPVLHNYLAFLLAVNQESALGRLAEAWLKGNPDPNDALWLPAQLSRLRKLAQTDPRQALTELRAIAPAARNQYAAALDLLEMDLLVFYLNDPSAVGRAAAIALRDPKSDTARLAIVRAGDFFRLQGQYAEAITRYQQAQRSVVEESAGRKLPAQDRAYSMTLSDLLEHNEIVTAEQKLTEWEARHPMAKLDSDFLIWRGRVLLARGRAREALAEIESYEKLLPESPYQIDADFYRAQALFALGQKEAARTIWTGLAKQYPQHPLADACREEASKP